MLAALLADFEQALKGRVCKFKRRETDWVFDFGDRRHITTDAPWRIVSEGRIAFADEDDGQKFGLPKPVEGERHANMLLKSRRIERVEVDPVTADIRIHFYGGVRLDVFTNSMAYESWQARFTVGDQTVELVGMGGGALSACRYDSASPPQFMTMKPLSRS